MAHYARYIREIFAFANELEREFCSESSPLFPPPERIETIVSILVDLDKIISKEVDN